MSKFVKYATELGPLVAFFIAYNQGGILLATKAILIASALAITLQFVILRTVGWGHILSVVILGLFGALTLYSGNSTFIKMKPTVIYAIFATALVVGLIYGKLFIKNLLSNASLQVDEHGWRLSTYLWISFFVTAACLNELIWRNCSEALWVNFKVFGMLPLTILFSILNAVILYRTALK